jgi:hypothetical protein
MGMPFGRSGNWKLKFGTVGGTPVLLFDRSFSSFRSGTRNREAGGGSRVERGPC